MNRHEQRLRAGAFLAAGALASSSAAVLIKLCGFPPQMIACFRLLIAGLVLLPFCAGSAGGFFARHGPRRFLLTLIPAALLGLHFQLWVLGLQTTLVASAVFIMSINPVFFALAQRFVDRGRLTLRIILALVVVLAGAAWLLYAGGGRLGRTGDLLVFISMLFLVAYLFLSGRLTAGMPHPVYVQVIYLWGGLLTLPFVFAAGVGDVRWTDISSWLPLLGLVVFPTLIGHTSANYGVRLFTPLTVSFVFLVEPVIASLLALWILDEAPPLYELPAYALFLGASAFYLYTRWRAGFRGV
ncbi:MAG: DMT family transporter [Spirochaetota bacterium]